MKTLNKIRHSRPAKSLPQKLAFSFLALLFGFGLGVFAKFLDGLSADQIPQWLSFFDIRNFFGLPLPWVFTTLVLVLFSRTPLRAAINAFCFLSGMLLGYYLYCAVFAGFLPDWSYLSVWLILTAVSPVLALICWYGRGTGAAATIIAALILAYFFLQAFTMNNDFSNFSIYDFPRYSYAPVVFLAAAVGILWRKPLQTLLSLLGGAAIAYIYLLLPFSIPYI